MKNRLRANLLKCSALLLGFTFLTSCSKDDDPSKTIEEEAKSLVLTVTSAEITEDDLVQFAVTTDNIPVPDAIIYVNGAEIADYEHTFTQAGTYKVVAKKEGYTVSEEIVVEVFERKVDVYVAGYEILDEKQIATYWKNGEPYYLTDGTNSATAHAIVVHGSDVYVLVSDGYAMKYWKNEEEHTIHNQPGWYAKPGDMVMSENGDLYITGTIRDGGKEVAKYWKNGVATDLIGDYEIVITNGIAVNGDNIYIVGSGGDNGATSFEYEPLFWENGALNTLPYNRLNGNARKVVVSGNEVHIVGYEYDITGWSAKYWKNGTNVPLSGGSEANDIFMVGEDAYLVGRGGNDRIFYWQNNTLIETLTGSYANGITVLNDIVYIVGGVYNREADTWRAVYWKNNVMVPLTDHTQDATVYSIAVIKR